MRVGVNFRTLVDLFLMLGSVWFAVDALRTGKVDVPVPNTHITYERGDNALGFWITVAVLLLIGIVVAIDLVGPAITGAA